MMDDKGVSKINKNVGYHIPPADYNRMVVTPGGGGDKVQYFPYKDIEPALKTVLSNIFSNVYSMSAPDDKALISSKDISFIFIPSIVTNSSSRASFTWPPTEFTVIIDCKALDASGKVIWQTSVKGESAVGIPDANRDFGLAGKIAVSKALTELKRAISSSEALK
jgi:hypothetical protein